MCGDSHFSFEIFAMQNICDPRSLARALGGDVSNGQVLAPGPGHSTVDRSLSIKIDPAAPDGFVVHSHSGDDPIACRDYVREKAGLPAFKPNGGGRRRASAADISALLTAAVSAVESEPAKGRVVATYPYTDAAGTPLYEVVRLEPKSFRQRRPDGNGGWIWSIDDTPRAVYRLTELLEYPDATVFVCEGEKDADRVASLGQCATTVACGVWTDDCVKALAGRDVIILEDADEPGVTKALKAATALHGAAKTVRVVRLPGQEFTAKKGGKDVSDWLDADLRRDASKLTEACFDAPLWVPTEAPKDETPKGKLALSSAEFVAGFTPPDYLVVGWLQRRFVYSLTAATGDGKTAIALLITLMISQGFKLGKLDFKCGRVLYFAGENPDDVRMRWLATTEQFGLTPEDIDNVYFVPGVFKFTEISERIREEMATRELALVVVDTSAAYFETDDENNNMQALAHAKRLRELSRLPGGPTVLICCHPTKNAESLVPRGGGAFLNEVDGNLTCERDDLAVTLHWRGKFRGPDFAPMLFQLKVVTHERLKDTDGNLIQTVVATALSDEGLRDMTSVRRADEDQVLLSINENPRLPSRDRAQQLGWFMKSGDPYHMRVVRAEKALERGRLITKARDGWELTKTGRQEVERIKPACNTA
jgi:5S rRNA maturation endonuclease (ribonuclease M5)